MTSVQIIETTLRDGLQNESVTLPTDTKVDLAARLVDFGARRIEVTSFVNPTLVPQLADAAELMQELKGLDASLAALVMNLRGLERALAAEVDEVNVVVVATDSFCRRNQRMSSFEACDAAADLVARARAAGVFTTVTIGASFGCPFEGEVSMSRLAEVITRSLAAGPDELALADTIGVAVPTDVQQRVSLARKLAPPGLPLRLHLHDTRHTGVANAAAGFAAGVNTLDATLGGSGGCPFAPNATGNVATEDLVYLFERMGAVTGLDLDGIRESAAWLETQLGKPLPGALLRAGGFPPRPKD